MAENSPVLLAYDGGIARLTFNRPEALNAINRAAAEALLAHAKDIASRDDLRAVVLNGNGPAFMAGGDVQTFDLPPDQAPAHFESLIDPVHAAVEILAELPQPVIASVHGAVAGAGFSLAMLADIVIASSDAKFTTAYTKLGVSADGSISWTLPRLVGLRKAIEMAWLSEVHDADEALRLGLINRVVAREELEEVTETTVRRLASGPTIAFGKMKMLMRQSLQNSLHEQLDAEKKALLDCVVTEDFRQGIGGFLRRQKPEFKGR